MLANEREQESELTTNPSSKCVEEMLLGVVGYIGSRWR